MFDEHDDDDGEGHAGDEVQDDDDDDDDHAKTEAVLRAVHPDVRPAATAARRPVVQADATHRGLAKAFVGHQHIVVQSCVVEPVCTCTVNHSSRK